MGDVFKEQLVKQQTSGANKAKKTLLYVGAGVIGFISVLFLGAFLGPLVLVGLLWGAMYLGSTFEREYEYSLTNSDLDVDVIYNKQRRKRTIEIDLKKINVMASIKDEKYKNELERAQKTIDASNGEGTKGTYAIMSPHEGENVKVLITPNEEMLTLIYKQAPHKVQKYRG